VETERERERERETTGILSSGILACIYVNTFIHTYMVTYVCVCV